MDPTTYLSKICTEMPNRLSQAMLKRVKYSLTFRLYFILKFQYVKNPRPRFLNTQIYLRVINNGNKDIQNLFQQDRQCT